MMEDVTKKLYAFSKVGSDLKTICRRFELSALAKEKMIESADSLLFLTDLINLELYPDAVHFLAHGLPKREAIWWAYLCASNCKPLENQPLATEMLALIKEWVYRPQEQIRRQVEPFAEKLQYQTAICWASLAVFWSGGSITPEGKPVVLPSEYLYAKGVAGAVMLAAVAIPTEVNVRYRNFLNQGIEIAQGKSGSV